MAELTDAQLLTIVKNTVEKHGCTLKNVDFERMIIDLEGPEAAKADCARALAEVLG
jgi:hypothetical protein